MTFDAITAIDMQEKWGLCIIPVHRSTKKPCIASWKEFQSRRPTESELEAWAQQFPDANYANITGAVSGYVVVDADGANGMEWVHQHLPVTGMYTSTGRPDGWHAWYKHPGHYVQNHVALADQVDVRGDGGYVVVPPSIHENGIPYEWQTPPGLSGWDDVPVYPDANRQTGNGFDLSHVKPLANDEPVARGQRNNKLAQIVGQKIQQGWDYDDILDKANGWNKRLSEPLPESEVRETVDSIWRTDLRNHPEKLLGPVAASTADAEPTTMEDGTAFVVDDTSADTGSVEIPERLMHPGGYIEMLMDYIRQSSAMYHPVYALGSSIAALGTLIGYKLCTQTGLRTNNYIVCLGFSGSGKNSPNVAIDRLFSLSHAKDYFLGDDFSHASAILRKLTKEEHRRGIAFFDEVGMFFRETRNPTSPAATIPALLLKLYSKSKYTKSYAVMEDMPIPWLNFSFVGYSTPVEFWKGMDADNARNGMFSRCDVFSSSKRGTRIPRGQRPDNHIPDALLSMTNAFADMDVPVLNAGGDGNLSDAKQDGSVPDPRMVPFSPEADDAQYSFMEKYDDLVAKYERTDELRSIIYTRVYERAAKFALIHAASMAGPDVEEIGIESWNWASELSEFLTEQAILNIQGNLAENDLHKTELRIGSIIRKYAAKNKNHRCQRYQLTRNIHGVPLRVIDDVLKKMESSGEISIVEYEYNERHVVAYVPLKLVEAANAE